MTLKIKCKTFGVAVAITLLFVLEIMLVSSMLLMGFHLPIEQVALVSCIAQISLFLVAVCVIKLRKKSVLTYCKFHYVPLTQYIIPILCALLYATGANIVLRVIALPQWMVGNNMENISNNLLISIISLFIVAPIVEEFFLRGLVLTRLRRAFSPKFSIVISALFFGLMHLMTGSLSTAIFAFFGGLIFALTFERTGSLYPAILAHSAGNLGDYTSLMVVNTPKTFQYIISGICLVSSIILYIILLKRPSEIR